MSRGADLADPARIAALRASGLLEHDLRGRLDLLCETAAQLLQVPMCRVNVLDDRMQMSVGRWPPGDLTDPRTTEVSLTACREVIVASEPVVVPDTLQHPVLCMLPFVTVSGARSYLGVPVFHDEQVIGAFCVADFVPRQWTPWDIAGLQGLARLGGLAVTGGERAVG